MEVSIAALVPGSLVDLPYIVVLIIYLGEERNSNCDDSTDGELTVNQGDGRAQESQKNYVEVIEASSPSLRKSCLCRLPPGLFALPVRPPRVSH